MITKENLKKISNNLVANRDNFWQAFRTNLFKYIENKEITMSDIANKSGVNYNTINTFLYGHTSDAKISNIINIARALEVSIDELVGAGTINDVTLESIRMCRNLPENDLYLVRWFIRYLDTLNKKTEPNMRYVSTMILTPNNNGDLKITSNYEKTDITGLIDPIKGKVFLGLKLCCENYMPYYSPHDIILIANDRPPKHSEHVIIRIGNCIYISKKKMENGEVKYFSIRDGKFRLNENEVDEMIGYVATKLVAK